MAGHDPPLIVRARDRSVAPLEDRAGLPLGPFPDRRYVAGEELLDPGDTLVMFTDGVTETMNASNELFGLERLRASLASTAAATSRRSNASCWSGSTGMPEADRGRTTRRSCFSAASRASEARRLPATASAGA